MNSVIPIHSISFQFTLFHSISLHFIPFQTISFHFNPFQTISFHFKPFHSISIHFKPFHSISFHFTPYHSISNYFIPFQSIHYLLFSRKYIFWVGCFQGARMRRSSDVRMATASGRGCNVTGWTTAGMDRTSHRSSTHVESSRQHVSPHSIFTSSSHLLFMHMRDYSTFATCVVP